MLLAGFALVVALFVLGTLELEPFDDAYFFKRVALHALSHKTLAWNVADGPVYGITSQLFQALEVVVVAFAGNHTLFWTRLILGIYAIGGFGLLLSVSHRLDRGLSLALAACSPVMLLTLSSGMETALLFSLLATLLWLLHHDRAAHFPNWVAPVVAVGSWLTRPDSLLLAAPVLLAERWRKRGRFPASEAAVLVLGIGAFLLLFRVYYGTALPLAFYAKSSLFSPYDQQFRSLCDASFWQHLGLFSVVALPLCLLGLQRRDATNGVLLGAALLFVVYHGAIGVDIMGMHARFLAPALPLLVLAAARASALAPSSLRTSAALMACYAIALIALKLGGLLPGEAADPSERIQAPYYLATIASACLLFFGPRSALAKEWASLPALFVTALAIVKVHGFRPQTPPSDRDYLDRHSAHVTVFRGATTLRSCFGDGLTLYHSEVGVIGLRFPESTVTDLSGLFNPKLLFGDQTFEAMCRHDLPEAIFLPHKNYATLNREILAGTCIQSYERVIAESSSPLYVRADLAPKFESCRQAESGPN